MVEQTPSHPQRTPVQLLEAQVQNLAEIHQAQLKEISILQDQNEKLARVMMAITSQEQETGFTHVKIEDINMPFKALVGFMVKVTLAAIPAGIIIAVLYALLMTVLGSFLYTIF